jgi:monovalent cation:H+ antiporter, CPA1 family
LRQYRPSWLSPVTKLPDKLFGGNQLHGNRNEAQWRKLVSLTVAGIPLEGLGLPSILIIVMLVLVGRALTVYPLCLLFKRTPWAIPMEEQHILWWGGLRGALSLGLALALPPSLAWRNEIVIAALSYR